MGASPASTRVSPRASAGTRPRRRRGSGGAPVTPPRSVSAPRGAPPSTPTDAQPSGEAPERVKKRWLTPRQRNLVEWVVVIGGALLVASLLRAFLFQTFFIPSSSMEPTLVPGDRVVVNKYSDSYGRGDIVVFHRAERNMLSPE